MRRAVRSIICIVAAALIIFGGLEIGLEYAHHQVEVRDHVEPITTNTWRYIVGGVLIVVGLILIAGSGSLAEQLTDDIEDEE